MEGDPYQADWEEDEAAIDPDSDMVDTRSEDDMDLDSDGPDADGAERQPTEVRPPGLDVTIDAFVELMTARDLDGIEEMLASDVDARFLGESSPHGVVEGLSDLLLRYPDLTLTRGDLGGLPVAASWVYDQEQLRYDLVGYFTIDPTDADPERIQALDFVEECPDPDALVVEVPDRSELPEWDDWVTQDEG